MAIETQLNFSREELLTASEVADVLRVKRATALDYMRRGVIPACKIGRLWYSSKPVLDSHLGHLFDPG
jgi:excisionase family DNA binding protein